MSLFSWLNSPDYLESVTFWFDVSGALVEFGVAITAGIIVHGEFGKKREKQLEKSVAVFAGIAAFLVLSTAFLNHRVSVLRESEAKRERERYEASLRGNDAELERLRKANVALTAFAKPRIIPPERWKYGVERLRKFAGTEVSVTTAMSEGGAFGTQLSRFLSEAGWKSEPVEVGMLTGGPGIRIIFSRESDIAAAVSLETFLNSVGIAAMVEKSEKAWQNSNLHVIIFKK